MRYKIIKASSAKDLVTAVDRFTIQGWVVAGGLCISKEIAYVFECHKIETEIFYQAITLKTNL